MDNLRIKITRMSDNAKMEFGMDCDWVIADKGLSGFGDISPELGWIDNPNRDGGIITSKHVGKKDRTIEAVYRHSSNKDVARNKVISFFNASDKFKISVVFGLSNVYAIGEISKFYAPERHLQRGKLSMSITFLFDDPKWLSTDDFGRNIAALRGMIAFPYCCSISPETAQGVTGGLFDFSQEVTLANDGNSETYPKIVIQADGGEVENPKITINNDKYVRVIDTMVDGESIEMDFAAQPPTIKKDGVNYVGHCDRTSSFVDMALKRGDNIIEYDADNGSSHMNVSVYYNKRYGAI